MEPYTHRYMLRDTHHWHDGIRLGLTRRAFLLGGTMLGLSACTTVPITGRWQFMLIAQDQELALGAQVYRQLLHEEPVTKDPRALEPMRRIIARLAPVANRPDYEWEVNVIKDDETINAFVLPGGKIAVYTGIFPIAQTEAGMAIIVGHEVGHAIARHAGERLRRSLGARIVGTALAVGLGASPHADLILAAYGLGARVGVLLPYSGRQESEADQIGLVLAKAVEAAMTRDQLFILVMVAFVLLINFAVRVLRKRVAGEAPRAREPEALKIPPRARRPPPVVAPRRPHEGPVAAPSPRAVPPVTRRWQAGAPVGALWTVRRGIVLMTILRPCRALEPPDDAR